jgi:putative membrane protein
LRSFIVGTIVTAIAFFLLTTFLPQFVSYDGDWIGLVVISVVFGLVNGVIGPIVRLLALPIRLMTLGLIGFVINAGLLLLTAAVTSAMSFDLKVGDFPPDLLSIDTLIAAIVGAIALSLVSTVVRLVIPDRQV